MMTDHTSVRPAHAVILAGGIGKRFGADTPKQFHEVNGRPIVYHTVEKFIRLEIIKNVVVVSPPEELWLTRMRNVLEPLMKQKNIEITIGGNTRHKSVAEGLKYLSGLLSKSSKNWQRDIVVIHDAARPFVTTSDILATITCARDYKGAGIALPIRGTAIELDEDYFLLRCLDRATHWSSEAPQAFQLGFIHDCYEKCSEYNMNYLTDCMQVAQEYGDQPTIKFCSGDPQNMKITYLSDLMHPSTFLHEYKELLLVLPEHTSQLDSLISRSCHAMSTTRSISDQLSIPSCSLDGLASFSDHCNSVIIYFIGADLKQQLPLQADRVLQALEKCSNHRGFCKLQAVLFFTLDNDEVSEPHNFRELFTGVCSKFSQKNLVCHLILTKDGRSMIDRVKKMMATLTDSSTFPSGQVLYF